MKKLATGAAAKAGDRRWQHVGSDGARCNCDDGTARSGCHADDVCGHLVWTWAEGSVAAGAGGGITCHAPADEGAAASRF